MLYDYFHKTYFAGKEFKKGIKGEMWCPGHPEGTAWASRQFEVFFKKFIDNKLTRGGGLVGNWNLNEQQSAMLYALALDDDRTYADGWPRLAASRGNCRRACACLHEAQAHTARKAA